MSIKRKFNDDEKERSAFAFGKSFDKMILYCRSFDYIFLIVRDIALVCRLILECWCKLFRNINRGYYIYVVNFNK